MIFAPRWPNSMQIWYNMGIDMDQKRHMLWHTNAKVRYSAAYPTGREHYCSRVEHVERVECCKF